jgi:hypothetical protein
MRDSIGNQLREGALVWMQEWACVARVAKIHDGGLSVVGHGKHDVTPPVLTIQVDIPLDPKMIPPGGEISLTGIMCLVDPRHTAAIEGMIKQ